jgi:hypothetical protein
VIVLLPADARYKIWHLGPRTARPWVVIRPTLTVVGYFRTFEQARRAYIGDTVTARYMIGRHS